jgi:hypothetical protein
MKMNKLFKTAILGAVALTTVLTSVEFAAAGSRDYYWRHGPGPRGYYHHGWGGRAVAAGALGLAAGAIIGGALAPQPEVVYRPRRVYVQPDPVYVEPGYEDEGAAQQDYYPNPPMRQNVRSSAGALEPWTAQWRSYCAQRYQSFNARTGTYKGYDNQDHFCTGA